MALVFLVYQIWFCCVFLWLCKGEIPVEEKKDTDYGFTLISMVLANFMAFAWFWPVTSSKAIPKNIKPTAFHCCVYASFVSMSFEFDRIQHI